MTFEYQNYLAHFGIKGQKWGIRRFQNADGTLTAEGRARYLGSDGRLSDKGRREIGKHPEKVAGNDLLQQWARYANTADRSKESLTPLAIAYQTEINNLATAKKISTTEAAKRLNKDRDWIGELGGKMLEDMGYEDTKQGREWMKQQPWMANLWTPIYS